MENRNENEMHFNSVNGMELADYWITKDGQIRNGNGKIIKQVLCDGIVPERDYARVILNGFGEGRVRHTFYVHRIMAEKFLGAKGCYWVIHKNKNNSDNRLENLEVVYDRPSYNTQGIPRVKNRRFIKMCSGGLAQEFVGLGELEKNGYKVNRVITASTHDKTYRGGKWRLDPPFEPV